MKTTTHDCGGYNSLFMWGYINSYGTGERIIWVVGNDNFAATNRAVIDNFGNLVEIK